jgi:hypothetical protein
MIGCRFGGRRAFAWRFCLAPEVDQAVLRPYSDVMALHWPPERKLVEEGYASNPCPFKEIAAQPFRMCVRWSLHDRVGYLGPWSSMQRLIEQRGTDPLVQELHDLTDAWGDDKTQLVRWRLNRRVSRIN